MMYSRHMKGFLNVTIILFFSSSIFAQGSPAIDIAKKFDREYGTTQVDDISKHTTVKFRDN